MRPARTTSSASSWADTKRVTIRKVMYIPGPQPAFVTGAGKAFSVKTLDRLCMPILSASGFRVLTRSSSAAVSSPWAALRIIPPASYRHEQTLAKPKADRLDLLRATRAHFGQIFMLYEDSGQVESLLPSSASPEITVTDEYGVLHRVWQVSDPQLIDSVRSAMSDKKLVIADGHHRYETALNYRNERRDQDGRAVHSASAAPPGVAPHEYVMMTFVNMSSPALLILPTHRVVHSLASFSEENFRNSARAFFDIEEVDPSLDAPHCTAILRESGRAGTTILAVTPNRAFLLHHPNPNAAQVFNGLSIRQQSLDVVQLHKVLLENVLHLSEESIRHQQNISYVRDTAEALAHLEASPGANIVFLMNPCRIAQVRDIAFAGEVMPQKSTDFYPKLLSGLTVYALD